MRAVDGVSYAVRNGETLGVVGESGCGKSVTALSILRLVADPPGRIVGGAIRLEGRNLLELSEPEMEQVRGNDISMIFQEPMTSLNPLLTVGGRSARRSSCIRACHGATRSTTPWRPCAASISRSRSTACAPIRTSSRAGCASG